jgi:hypothetical protein
VDDRRVKADFRRMLTQFPMPKTLLGSAERWREVFLADAIGQALFPDVIARRNKA